ncbi:FxsA family protein [Desulfocurvus sp. DL9XJH121]
MLLRLFLAFTLIPVLEIYLLIKVGSFIGAEATIAVVLLTGFVGAWLARAQGAGVLARMRENMARGIPPGAEMVDAALILVAGVVLLTPGFATDLAGILLLIPPVRAKLRDLLRRKLEQMARGGTITIIHR